MANGPSEQPAAIVIRPDREGAVYDIGETISFHIEPTGAGELPEELPYALTWDGALPITAGVVHPGGCIEVRVDQPGFVRLKVGERPAEKGPPVPIAQAAVAVAPECIQPSLPPPEDFDAFWRERLAEDGPAREPVVQLHEEQKEATVYCVMLPGPGGYLAGPDSQDNIYAWLLRPKGPGPFPAVVRYHGSGIYGVSPENGLDLAARGLMVLSVNSQALPNDEPREFYVALRESGSPLADYRTRPEAFVRMLRRATRAANYLATRPDWDGRHLISEGHSQGAGQAITAAALSLHVTALVISCATLCDHTRPLIGGPAGWPKIIPFIDGKPDPEKLAAARYIDGMNFAPRISCPAYFGICFLDDLCPPTGAYATFNSLRGLKSARHEPAIGHIYTDGWREASYAWMDEHIRT